MRQEDRDKEREREWVRHPAMLDKQKIETKSPLKHMIFSLPPLTLKKNFPLFPPFSINLSHRELINTYIYTHPKIYKWRRSIFINIIYNTESQKFKVKHEERDPNIKDSEIHLLQQTPIHSTPLAFIVLLLLLKFSICIKLFKYIYSLHIIYIFRFSFDANFSNFTHCYVSPMRPKPSYKRWR